MWRASAFSDYQGIRRIIRGQIQYRRETGKKRERTRKEKEDNRRGQPTDSNTNSNSNTKDKT